MLEINEKIIQNYFSLSLSLRATLSAPWEADWEADFEQKKTFLSFIEILDLTSKHYSQLKKHLKFNPEKYPMTFWRRLAKKNPMSGNVRKA